jgi:hypothetical protein
MSRVSEPKATPNSPARLHVIVTCTDRKKVPGPASLKASSLPQTPLADRLAAWTRALETAPATPVTAEQLYSGDQWHVARSLGSSGPSDVQVCTWVASAGYGLIRPETLVKPYAATFTTSHPDTVVPRGASYGAADWWEKLAGWRYDDSDVPRTVEAIARLAAGAKGDFVLVAASESYAIALMDDLQAAAELLPDRFALISVGLRIGRTRLSKQHAAFLMPGEKKLQTMVGGATQSLNARLARNAVMEASQWLPSTARLRTLIQGWIDALPPAVRYDRNRMSDDEVRAFIDEQLHANPRATHTALLRTLRDAGQACEQARFAAAFRKAISTNGGVAVQSPPAAESGA